MTFMTDSRTGGLSITARISEYRDTLATRASQYRKYRNTLIELRNLTDRELSDLGLARGNIKGIALEAAYD